MDEIFGPKVKRRINYCLVVVEMTFMRARMAALNTEPYYCGVNMT